MKYDFTSILERPCRGSTAETGNLCILTDFNVKSEKRLDRWKKLA